ncbi:hypothetical protein TCAL_09502 [Tigriopus californicus]|uniref:Sulfotransferase domain-containing protein n=1 Tax=Tigriopus californicus TaxID=6832 RepID=A0A553PCM6_TIGCA|nr:hypothetical protein TCAL_09502 [Tigriopus californicus]
MLKYGGFKMIRSFYQTLDVISEKVVKYSLVHGHQSDKLKKANDFENCAHVHESYTHPNVIFEDGVTLLTLTPTHAIFAKCPEDIDVHAHSTGPFFYINQFNHCKHLILIPLNLFIALTNDVDALPFNPESVSYVLLSNTGRCGSTLLTQLFEDKVKNAVAISEPDFVMAMVTNHENINYAFRQKLIRGCVFALTASAIRRFKHDNPKNQHYNVLIKPKAHGIALTPELAQAFPSMKHLYLYRHPIEYYKSLKAVYRALLHPLVDILMMKLSIKMEQDEFILSQFPFANRSDTNEHLQLMKGALNAYSSKQKTVLLIGLYVANLLSIKHQAKELGIDFKVISFQELKDTPEIVFKDVIDFCGIAINEDANFKALPDSDSQQNSVLSRSNLSNYQTPVTDQEKKLIDALLQICHLPSILEFSNHSLEFQKQLQL